MYFHWEHTTHCWEYIGCMRIKVDCFEKPMEGLAEFEERRILRGKLKPTPVRLIIVMQAKRSCRKGFLLLLIQINDNNEANNNTRGDS